MVNLFARFSNNRKQLYIRRNKQALDDYQMLKATLFDSGRPMNGTAVRYDASLSKVGRYYKLLVTSKSGSDSIRFFQRDFFTIEELEDYLREKTVFLITDFKLTAVPAVNFDPLIALMGKN